MDHSLFDLESWTTAPATHPAAEFDAPGVHALFYDALPYRGRPTRIFAWIGLPEGASASRKVPGVVLVHGGGGTAFAEWVRLWTSRGYAAIAMDLNGHVPRGTNSNWDRHADGGPAANAGKPDVDGPRNAFFNPDGPVAEAWPYHAVADVILAHSLLRSMPEVDADRIGITGISWGGWVTSIVVGVDPRFRCAVPVYGCGFIHEGSAWTRDGSLNSQRDCTWIVRWEPSKHLPRATLPMLWINGTNDFAYWPPAWTKSSRLPQGQRTMSLQLRMPHGHGGVGEYSAEICAFMNHHLRGGPALARCIAQGEDAGTTWATFSPPGEGIICRAEILFTTSDHPVWPERPWDVAPAHVVSGGARITAAVPTAATAYVLNAVDEAGRVVSTEPVFR